MFRSREYINEQCPISGQAQHITVYFKAAKPEAKSLADYKRDHFICDNNFCKFSNSYDCPIYRSSNP